jgi:hypothetical protein
MDLATQAVRAWMSAGRPRRSNNGIGHGVRLERQRVDVCQRAIGGHNLIVRRGMTDAQIREAIPWRLPTVLRWGAVRPEMILGIRSLDDADCSRDAAECREEEP